MYKVKKLFFGRHELDNGRTWCGFGYAVVNNGGQIKSGPPAEVYEAEYAAVLAVEYFNEVDEQGAG